MSTIDRPGGTAPDLSALLQDLAVHPVDARAPTPGAGERVADRFEVVRELGRGGFGVVVEAHDTVLGRPVALKLLRPGKSVEAPGAATLAEAVAISKLSHPNIVQLHDQGLSAQGPFLVLELLEGETLSRRIARGPMALPEATRVALQVARGLAHAHVRGVVHRDLKPSNVFLCADGQVKVLDFGLAHLLGRAHRFEGGTPGWMAPEQRRRGTEDERTDVWALGAILSRAVAGDDPSTAHLEIPGAPDLEALVEAMLSPDPAGRPRDGARLVEALEPISRRLEARPAEPTTAPAPGGLLREQQVSSRASMPVSLRRALVFTVLALLVLAIGYLAATHGWQGGGTQGGAGTATLAVLPFKPILAADRDEALELGMADTLITRLSGIAGAVVRPLSSVRRYAQLEQDPLVAARALGVESVLDGSVQKSGDRLRVTARLLSVADGRQLWSESFDERYSDIFAVQDSIAGRVTAALALRLSPVEQRRIKRRATSDAVAYDLFLNGRYHWNRRTSADDLGKAIEFYSRAIGRDPRFALAHSGLAEVVAAQAAFGIRAPREVYPRALASLEIALELDPDLAEAYATRGRIRMNYQLDWQGALEDFDVAIRLDPRHADAYWGRGVWLTLVGRGKEGLTDLQTAKDLEPDSLATAAGHARGLYWARRYGEAEAELKRVLEVDPRNRPARGNLIRVYTQQGRYEDALELWSREEGRSPGSYSFKGVALALAGRAGEARDELRRLTELGKRDYVPAYDIAAVSAALGDVDGAFAWLDRAVVERSPGLTALRVDPVMDRLRSDPRYASLEKELRIPPR